MLRVNIIKCQLVNYLNNKASTLMGGCYFYT